MVGSTEPGMTGQGDSDQTLLSETERVLDNQIDVIQEQQNQSTRVLRVLLTTFGLLLTLLSIAVSSNIVDIPNPDNVIQVLRTSPTSAIIFTFVIFAIGYTIVVLARVVQAALLVLSPSAEKTIFSDLFTSIIPYDGSITLSQFTSPSEDDKLNKDLSDISPRSGVDAQSARDISMERDGETQSSILNYHIGCMYGNELIIKSNREHLRRIYRIISVLGLVLGVLLLYSILFAFINFDI